MKEKKMSKIEENLKKESLIIQKEIIAEEKGIVWFLKSHTFKMILYLIGFVLLITAILYFVNAHNQIKIDKSEISAPVITLSSQSAGILDKVLVREGDYVYADMIVAQVNGVPIKSKIDGIVTFVQNTPGQFVSTQTPIVKMINPEELRVIGHIEEDKGLVDIKSGQKVIFTVDAFGSKKFKGTVESIAATSRDSAIAFSISDKRAKKEFDIKVKFDNRLYDQFKNGMSARMTIYK